MKLAGLLLSLTLMIPGVALAYDIGPAVGTTLESDPLG